MMKQALTDAELRVAMEELARREGEKGAQAELIARIESEMFDKQVAFHRDPSRFKAVLGSRRAGKTECWVRVATIAALQNPRMLVRVWHSSRLRAKDMLWASFRWLHARHSIPVVTNETELSITFQNGAVIRLVGADKDKEAQKKRGDKTCLEIILEVQNFGSFLRSIIEDVIGPSLMDVLGTLCIEGTPGPLCQGVWYEISGEETNAQRWFNRVLDPTSGQKVDGEWSCHRWTLLDNPHLPHARLELDAIKKRKRWADDNPTYLREYCGFWVNDLSALFYKFDLVRNTYSGNEVVPYGPGWFHALGWDLGYRDDMALVVWGWRDGDPNLYEVCSWSRPGALAKEVMDKITEFEKRYQLNLIVQVADTAGGGKMYVEEVMSRYARHFEPAKKTDKYDHVSLFNDNLLTGHIKLRLGSAYQLEIGSLMRDPEWPDPEDPEKPPTEVAACPNHMCFVAGTGVLTSRGELPVESLAVGDLVWTREGLKPVVKVAPTGVKPVIERLGLRGTPDHPVWTENRGWVKLDSLTGSDVLLYACQTSQSSGAASRGIDIQALRVARSECTIPGPAPGVQYASIAQSGKPPSAPYRPDFTYTTSTKTPVTTPSKTSSASQGVSTFRSTPRSISPPTPGQLQLLSKRQELLRLSGTVRQTEERGTQRMRSESWPYGPFSSVGASYAETPLAPKSKGHLSALLSATLDGVVKAVSMIRSGCARLVSKPSPSTSTRSSETALVYAVTVADCHEYFANGILVSNCDAGLYAWRTCWNYVPKTEKVRQPHKNTEDWILQMLEKEDKRASNEDASNWGFGAGDEDTNGY